jgi:hypothetical protein
MEFRRDFAYFLPSLRPAITRAVQPVLHERLPMKNFVMTWELVEQHLVSDIRRI